MSTDADFEWLDVCGRGAYGEVHRVKDKRSREIVAIKLISRPAVDRFVIEEFQNLSKCNHPQIIKFKEAYVTDNHLAIVMEYASGGDLHSFMTKEGRLSERHARWLFQQLMTGVEYCHSQSIIVRDLKLENTLLTSGHSIPLIKIADFGVSKSSPQSILFTKNVGTPGYTAPEVLQGSGSYNGSKADIWSAGVLLYLLVFGEHPFVDLEEVKQNSFKNTHARITRCLYTFPAEVAVSNELKDLLQRIFVADSRKRIDMNQIFEHPWFLKDLPAPVLESRNTRRQSSQNLEKLNQVIADAKVTA